MFQSNKQNQGAAVSEPALVQEIPYRSPAHIFPVLESQSHAIFLDSAMEDPRLGNMSYIAFDPFLTFHVLGNNIIINNQTQSIDGTKDAPLRKLKELHENFKLSPKSEPNLPPFQGGIAGLFSYDMGWFLEDLPENQDNDAEIPEIAVGFYDLVLAFDHIQEKCWLISTGQNAETSTPNLEYAIQRKEQAFKLLNSANKYQWPDQIIPPLRWHTDLSRADYEARVQQVIDYIYSGDIFQANLSQQFRAKLPDGFNSLAFYKNLRRSNGATFCAYMKTDSFTLASSSPERFIKVQDHQAETRPIKGTRPRFDDAEQDRNSAAELLAAEKDRAENVMIVDLLRNDLSKNCEPHTVSVPELCALESYSTVHHLVSSITGQLKQDSSSLDLLFDAFPGGSITGAPKIRAMEIIAELEPWRRGAYCGAIGYVSFSGEMDTNILIRTVTLKNNMAYFNVGGGIVADSVPASEFEETLVKARGIFNAFNAMSSGKSVIIHGDEEDISNATKVAL
ncbi:MAG: aminodeoxychorismate synthase component I [Alphaproteobacteria bacterium]|nr:aminodeoxychorismate synthase component I [Alphaproteobacteria bacterium]